jgi:NADH-quinone oxidoreductase subunit J
MTYLILFAAVSVAAVLSSLLVFLFKDMLHAATALAVLFFVNSLLFVMLNQPLLAIIQLFIMIGGISTFLFVGVASASLSHFRHTRMIALVVLWLTVFAAMSYPLLSGQAQFQGSSRNVLDTGSAVSSLNSSISLFYILAVLLFGIALSSIILLKKIDTKSKVRRGVTR